ncbi:hypothetical protein CONLIGDRAFT_707031 [Coniochaeta ligniaria NRRL 30616]|uniref:F-box domain-containing protein n=1 Tax=Coniochaeta ligniaria NRRL 30616 TaxID=1408157 RepID=A0A1J7IHA3_9PEZI|nr:hypothetical protein CONLIGDRAFT_707031 [Coniochaeta ligniaria NRRL 30616]
MAVFTDLPLEVVAEVLKNLDSLESLSQIVLTCRHIYSAVKEIPAVVAATIRNEIPHALLPYAVAVQQAQDLVIPREYILHNLYERPAFLAAHLTRQPMSKVRMLLQTYKIIQKRATELATISWARVSRFLPPHPPALFLSPTENVRFCRAFYRVELWHAVFDYDPQAANYWAEDNEWYFSRFRPWELEQFRIVYRFLGQRLTEGWNRRTYKACTPVNLLTSIASCEVLTHDVECGYKGISCDDGDLLEKYQWKHQYLSKGIMFHDRMMKAISYDARRDLISSTWRDGSCVSLAQAAHWAAYNFPQRHLIHSMSEEELLSLLPRSLDDDTDGGSKLAWRLAMRYFSFGSQSRLGLFEWLWMVAYVFWDRDRVERHDYSAVFGLISERGLERETDIGHWSTDIGHWSTWREVQESMRERREIWEEGGSGYWSKGDLSRIDWLTNDPAELPGLEIGPSGLGL